MDDKECQKETDAMCNEGKPYRIGPSGLYTTRTSSVD